MATLLPASMTATRHAVVLVNSAAARATPRALRRAESVLRDRLGADFRYPRTASELAGLAGDAARAGSLLIVAGGDGTINVTLNALAGHDAPLGILPLGTANDLARHLQIPPDPAAAAERIAAGTLQRIDVIEVNGRRFCTVGGLGLVAQSAESVNRLRAAHRCFRAAAKPLRSEIYSLAAIANIICRRQIVGHVQLCDLDSPEPSRVLADENVHGIFAANQRSLGGGLTLPTASQNTDGRFEICLVRATSRLRLIAALHALRRGRPLPDGIMAQHQVRHVRISCDRDDAFLGDGEILCRGRTFELRIHAAAQAFIC